MSQLEFFGVYGLRGPCFEATGALFARIDNCGAKGKVSMIIADFPVK
jgi:hypothetical protein